ncbi:MAG: TIR domain-containing protein, partial [Chloroflexota bacterium]
MRVFISYKSEYRPFAAQLRDRLQAWGFGTWFDRDDIPEGAYFRHEIQKGLEASDVVVGVMTEEAFQSREVMWEWDYALAHSRFVPVRYHDVALPYHLQGQQYIDFVADVNAGFEQLRHALLNPSPPAPRPPAPPTSTYRIDGDVSGKNVAMGGVMNVYNTVYNERGEPVPNRRDDIAPQTKTEKSNRAVMLDKVYDSWIVGVLQTSVGEGGKFDIGMQMAPNRVLKHRDYADYDLPDTSADILRVFEDELRELLILGAPGAGKTILLLQLAEKLIEQARADKTK